MPGNLNKHLNGYASAAEIKKIFGSIKTARNTSPEVRTRVIFGTSRLELDRFAI